jgi:hypothetical protein
MSSAEKIQNKGSLVKEISVRGLISKIRWISQMILRKQLRL